MYACADKYTCMLVFVLKYALSDLNHVARSPCCTHWLCVRISLMWPVYEKSPSMLVQIAKSGHLGIYGYSTYLHAFYDKSTGAFHVHKICFVCMYGRYKYGCVHACMHVRARCIHTRTFTHTFFLDVLNLIHEISCLQITYLQSGCVIECA